MTRPLDALEQDAMRRQTASVVATLRQRVRDLERDADDFERRCDRYRSALEHYADARFWLFGRFGDTWARSYQPDRHGYDVARAALRGTPSDHAQGEMTR